MRAIVMFIGNLLFIKDTLHANVFIFLICYIILRLHVDNVYDLFFNNWYNLRLCVIIQQHMYVN